MNFRSILLLFVSGMLCISCNENKGEQTSTGSPVDPEQKPLTQQEGPKQGEKESQTTQKELKQGEKKPTKKPEGPPAPSSQELFKAIKANNTAEVKKLLDKKADPNVAEDGSGYTPLHWAALNNNSELAQQLLDKGAKVDEKTAAGITPLMLASLLGATETAKALIKSKADVNASLKSFTPVYFATAGNNLETVKLLVEAGAHVDQGDTDKQKLLYFAVPSRDDTLQPLYYFLETKKAKALDINRFFDLDLGNLLQAAAIFFDDSTLMAFLAKNLENIEDEKEKTKTVEEALRIALENSNFRSGQFLLKLIDDKKQAEVKNFLLYKMAQAKRPEAVKFLLKQGTDVNAKALFPSPSALHVAMNAQSPEIIKILLDAGASIDLKDTQERTPFFHAINFKYADAVKALLLHEPKLINKKSENLNLEYQGINVKDCSPLAYAMLLMDSDYSFEEYYPILEALKQSPNVDEKGVQCIVITKDKEEELTLKDIFDNYIKNNDKLKIKAHFNDLKNWVDNLK